MKTFSLYEKTTEKINKCLLQNTFIVHGWGNKLSLMFIPCISYCFSSMLVGCGKPKNIVILLATSVSMDVCYFFYVV